MDDDDDCKGERCVCTERRWRFLIAVCSVLNIFEGVKIAGSCFV